MKILNIVFFEINYFLPFPLLGLSYVLSYETLSEYEAKVDSTVRPSSAENEWKVTHLTDHVKNVHVTSAASKFTAGIRYLCLFWKRSCVRVWVWMLNSIKVSQKATTRARSCCAHKPVTDRRLHWTDWFWTAEQIWFCQICSADFLHIHVSSWRQPEQRSWTSNLQPCLSRAPWTAVFQSTLFQSLLVSWVEFLVD